MWASVWSGAGRDAQALGAARHGRVVDRLDVDAVLLEQQVGRRLAGLGVADHHRHDVGLACRAPAGRRSARAALTCGDLALLRARARPREALRWRTEAVAAAATAGGSAVVKMKPGA